MLDKALDIMLHQHREIILTAASCVLHEQLYHQLSLQPIVSHGDFVSWHCGYKIRNLLEQSDSLKNALSEHELTHPYWATFQSQFPTCVAIWQK